MTPLQLLPLERLKVYKDETIHSPNDFSKFSANPEQIEVGNGWSYLTIGLPKHCHPSLV